MEAAQSADYERTVGSLFSGIGGIDLGLERAGFRVIWQAEMDPYASWVLKKHWPDVPNLGDVTTVDWSKVARPHVLAGGFPCQPVSSVGRGLAERDPRWLWPAFASAIRLLGPDYVLLENVPGLLVRGMGSVLGGLAALGYDAEWRCIPAGALGAPHLRWRVFILAYPQGRLRHGIDWGKQSALRPARPDPWSAEPDVDRMAHGVPARVDRLRCLGNAVVPQVAEYVGRRLLVARPARIDGNACG